MCQGVGTHVVYRPPKKRYAGKAQRRGVEKIENKKKIEKKQVESLGHVLEVTRRSTR
jgi:hypothetical protein